MSDPSSFADQVVSDLIREAGWSCSHPPTIVAYCEACEGVDIYCLPCAAAAGSLTSAHQSHRACGGPVATFAIVAPTGFF